MKQPLSVLAELDDWGILSSFFPEGWRQKARECGALTRARGIAGPDALLRILLIHIANGCSLAETSLRAEQLGLGQLNQSAVYRRLRSAEEWLRWMAGQMRVSLGFTVPKLSQRVLAVDATAITEPGSTGTGWRIHYAIDLATLQCDFFLLTDVKGGETWRRFPVMKGDIMLGDRGYANPNGVAHVVEAGGEVVVRLNRKALPPFDKNGKRLNAVPLARRLKPNQNLEWETWVHTNDGKKIRGRLIIVRRSKQATEYARKKLKQEASKKQKSVSAVALEAAEYFFLWTALPQSWSRKTILQLYRCRWQIGVSRQGHIVQPVKDRPRPTDSGLVAWEAPWRENKTVEPSGNMLRKECARRTRLQCKVNADVASLHEIPVAETVDNARKQKGLAETGPMRQLSPAGYQRRHGVKDDVETGEALGARRRNPVEEMPAITVSGKCGHRHQGDGSGRSTGDGRAAKRARREGPGPVSNSVRQGEAGVR